MESSNQDKAQGTFHASKGKVGEMVGEITDNSKLESIGKAEEDTGIAQQKVGQYSRRYWGNKQIKRR